MNETYKDMTTPLPRAYWVIPGKFLAGAYPGSPEPATSRRQLKSLFSSGIHHIINLTEEKETGNPGGYYPPYRDQWLILARESGLPLTMDRMPIRDTWIPTRVEMCRILDQIDTNIHREKPVYVHCIGGRGRTGTVVGCYLARHGLADGEQALMMIEALRSHQIDSRHPSPETPQQMDLVLSWVAGE